MKYETIQDAYAGEVEHLPCVTNRRHAEVEDPVAMERYVESMKRGCCGSMDTVVLIKSGEVVVAEETHKIYKYYLIGCNYGH